MEKLNYEKDFPYYASGGFINYCEFPCLQSNPKALEAVWDYAYNIGIGYLARTRRSTAATIADSKATSSPLRKVSSAGVRQLRPGPLQRDQAHLRLLGQPGAAPMVHGRHEEIAHRVKHMSGETGHVTLSDGSEREWFEEAK